MKGAIVLCLFLLGAVAAVPASSNRIIGGSATTINQYPSIVPVLYTWDYSSYWQRCAGTILNTRSVLSCAHCYVRDLNVVHWRIRVGSTFSNSGGVVHNVASMIIHPNYDGTTYDNDVAILRTATIISYVSNAVQPGNIAGSNYNIADNQHVWAAGWGATFVHGWNVDQLRHVQIYTINQAICRQRYATRGRPVTDNMICSGVLDVGGRDQCQGDSGGPLYHNNVVVGICSWGIGCADRFLPGVNARVSRYTNWIQANA